MSIPTSANNLTSGTAPGANAISNPSPLAAEPITKACINHSINSIINDKPPFSKEPNQNFQKQSGQALASNSSNFDDGFGSLKRLEAFCQSNIEAQNPYYSLPKRLKASTPVQNLAASSSFPTEGFNLAPPVQPLPALYPLLPQTLLQQQLSSPPKLIPPSPPALQLPPPPPFDSYSQCVNRLYQSSQMNQPGGSGSYSQQQLGNYVLANKQVVYCGGRMPPISAPISNSTIQPPATVYMCALCKAYFPTLDALYGHVLFHDLSRLVEHLRGYCPYVRSLTQWNSQATLIANTRPNNTQVLPPPLPAKFSTANAVQQQQMPPAQSGQKSMLQKMQEFRPH